jgi:hypothetical protein
MIILSFFNNLNSYIYPLLKNEFAISIIHGLSYFLGILLVNMLAYGYMFLKFFKIMCYSKMTFEWLPMINPYIWPFSFFHVITGPYFTFWSKVLPSIKFENTSVEVSGIVALEALNSCLYFCVRVVGWIIPLLNELEASLTIEN